ncbi:ribonuclease Y [candidate division WWE3 bacterium]|nr:ribonuclease Y [candidate division WWE3 bacterium]
MQLPSELAFTFVLSAFAAIAVFYFVNAKKSKSASKEKADDSVLAAEARAKAKEIILEAKDEAFRVKSEADEALSKKRVEWTEVEKRLAVSKVEVETKSKQLEEKNVVLEQKKAHLDKKQLEIEELYARQQDKLQSVAGLSKEEAKIELIESFEKQLAEEKGKLLRQMEEDVKKEADTLAREILIDAMRYGATDYVVEYTVSRVKLPDEDMKGRIIGKEGRNIKAFEERTGVDLDLDSSPGDVVVSCFDPVRREVAKVALEKLIADGRIQPVKIEEVVEATKAEIDRIIYKEGDNLCHRVGVYSLPKDIVYMLGKFKYRFSYGQNMIEHTLEETRIGVAMAKELGLNAEVVKLGCLLHDIGKVVSDEEGTHVQLGVDLLKKHKLPDEVINCVAEHHEDKPFSSLESAVVNLADHVSGARPAARSEDYESYTKRLKDLEDAATSFDGVDRAHAISAGREVRVFVIPEKVDDASARLLVHEIARKIELEQTYPGTVKVTVIRETRVTETAR